MIVTRVQDADGSHIEPPLDQDWPELDKLTWKAAAVAHDTGLQIAVHDGARLYRDRQPIPGWYGITVGSTSTAALDFVDAWTYLAGVQVGAEQQAQRHTA